ncbi:MAG TPA: protein kinase [Polyangiaceae bacterium]|jgi:serine/threonine-protein kinase|nr:protein kinase [Polyangiaceae bacterium]
MAVKPIFKPGRRCGETYEIVSLIHQGPNAETYAAFHRVTQKTAILTCSRFSHVEGDPPSEAMFVATAKKLAALAVDEVPRIYGFGVSGGVYWIASQFFDEPAIVEMHALRQDKSPEWRLLDALAVGIHVQSILEKAHALGVLHGSLRPACILIRGLPNDCNPCLLELGYADLFMLNRAAAQASPRYRPPEQIAGSPIDARSDIYSLGMSLYHLIGQAPPYADKAPVSTSARLLEMAERELPTPLPDLTKHCPAIVWEFVAKAIDKDPTRRFQSADEIGDALEVLINQILENRNVDPIAREQERKLAAELQAKGQARMSARDAQRVLDDSAEPTTVPPGADTKRRRRAALAQARAGLLGGDPSSRPRTPRNDVQPTSAPRPAEIDPDSDPVTLPSAPQGVASPPGGARQPAWRARVALGGSALVVGGLAALVTVAHVPATPSAAIAWPAPTLMLPELPTAATPAPVVPAPQPPSSAVEPPAPAVIPAPARLRRVRPRAAPPAPSTHGSATAPEAPPSGSATDPCNSGPFLCSGSEPLPGQIDTD